MTYKFYFNDIKAKEKIKEAAKKYKNKKIVLYGMGEFFDEITENFDLSELNIVGVCDLKFEKDKDCNQTKYKAIAPSELIKEDFDVILITTFFELNIIKYLKEDVFKGKRKIIKPLLSLNIIDLIKILASKEKVYFQH